MARIPEYSKIFNNILSALESGYKTHKELLSSALLGLGLSEDEMSDNSFSGKLSVMRSRVGTVITDMERKGIIARGADGIYKTSERDQVVIRIEQCEEEILDLVRKAPRTRAEIRDALTSFFGTDATPTLKDDNRLYTYIGQTLKKMTHDNLFVYDGKRYSIPPDREASIKNHAEVLSLKREFLTRIHARGGEFFEYYFLNLLTKYLTRTGKTVTEGYVTGGSDDGGIDGIIKTVDSLGFRELIMIQMKNRNVTATETDIRGFYGAVCAKQGSRGIYATVSDFHPMAQKLLDSIDNCVGVGGDKIFSMACDSSYGIKRDGDRLVIDGEII